MISIGLRVSLKKISIYLLHFGICLNGIIHYIHYIGELLHCVKFFFSNTLWTCNCRKLICRTADPILWKLKFKCYIILFAVLGNGFHNHVRLWDIGLFFITASGGADS